MLSQLYNNCMKIARKKDNLYAKFTNKVKILRVDDNRNLIFIFLIDLRKTQKNAIIASIAQKLFYGMPYK